MGGISRDPRDDEDSALPASGLESDQGGRGSCLARGRGVETNSVSQQALSGEGCLEGQETPERFTLGMGVGRQEISEKDAQGFLGGRWRQRVFQARTWLDPRHRDGRTGAGLGTVEPSESTDRAASPRGPRTTVLQKAPHKEGPRTRGDSAPAHQFLGRHQAAVTPQALRSPAIANPD